jgi:membrane protease YdiL (CAAX protease family)
MSEMSATMNTQGTSPGQLRSWLQVAAIILLLELGGVLGALTGFIPLSPILSVLLPLAAATWFLRRDGQRWGALAFSTSLRASQLVGYAALALVAVYATVFALGVLLNALGLPGADHGQLQLLIEGNTAMYLWFLLPISWGSAAIGEELLARGFLLYRLEGMTNTATAILLQAAIFGVAHFYQGLPGILTTFLVGLVFGVVYVKCGRSLLPVIIAHGVIDTIAVTVLYMGRADLLGWG